MTGWDALILLLKVSRKLCVSNFFPKKNLHFSYYFSTNLYDEDKSEIITVINHFFLYYTEMAKRNTEVDSFFLSI